MLVNSRGQPRKERISVVFRIIAVMRLSSLKRKGASRGKQVD
jgi:hypothetical protein